jgi:hypothetical protein
MKLESAIELLNNKNNKLDILEILWIDFSSDFLNEEYYNKKIKDLPKWDYFFSDLDGTFFRWVLQKEAFTLFVKFVKKQDILKLDPNEYSEFISDLKFFDKLEKQAYNKEIPYFVYLHAWIYLLIKHSKLVEWNNYLQYLHNNFSNKEKITPYRFSYQKLSEILLSWKKFLFISWAPNFIFDIYLDLLKIYVEKNIWKEAAKNIYWFWTNINIKESNLNPLWWLTHKSNFIKLLKEKNIINSTIWWMWDTSSDFWISYEIDKDSDFYFVNPDRKVIENFEELKVDDINFHLIFERKDLIYEMKKEDITLL